MRRYLLALVGLALLLPHAAASQQSGFWVEEAPAGELLAPSLTVADLSDLGDLVDTPPPPVPSELGWYLGGFLGIPPEGQNDPRYVVDAPSPLGGVSRLLINFPELGGGFGCSGALLNRFSILTAAHCVTAGGLTAEPGNIIASFWDRSGSSPTQVDYVAERVFVHPDYDPAFVVNDNDVAVIRLSEPADAWIPRYGLFTGNPLFRPVVKAGYGATGNGVTGAVLTNQFDDFFGGVPVLRAGLSSWEMTRDRSFLYAGFGPATQVLVSDFDGYIPPGCWPVNPHPILGPCWPEVTLESTNTTCNIWEGVGLPPVLLEMMCHSGYGIFEVATAGGDSGGPAFVWDEGRLKVAAVASFGDVFCFPSQAIPPNTSPGCPEGAIGRQGVFSALNGHNAVGFGSNYGFVQSSVVPEPGTLVLLGSGLVGVLALAYRRRDRDE